MSNDNYKTIRISVDVYEKLRELKFRKNKSYISILEEAINKEYEKMNREEKGKKWLSFRI